MTDATPREKTKTLAVTYYRVSTQRQGISQLGLLAQRSAVERFLTHKQGKIIGEFVEVETGKKSDRPQLLEALALCKKKKATLVIATLDRLARNVHFISGLMESGVEFLAVDMPTKDRFMLHVQAAFAAIYIDPGSPWQNGQVESFHNRLRDECLNRELFPSVTEARVVIEEWRRLYNRIHPHSNLGFQSPDECATNYERLALISAPATPAFRSMPA